jgi:hypothetical protein
MGCHTWFERPVTKDEFEFFKSNAIEDARRICGDTEENRKLGIVDMNEFHKVKQSVEENTDYWWKNGYGTRVFNKSEYTDVINGIMYIDLAGGHSLIFENIKRYHDIFRIKTYPRKVIHNKRELRRYLRKKYFELEKWQLERISEFFKENRDGIIMFG